MRTTLLLLTLLALNTLSFAQSPNYTIGGSDSDVFHTVFQKETGFVVFTTSTSTISGDKTVANNSNSPNAWIIELDSNMSITSQMVISGDWIDRIEDVIKTNDSGYLMSLQSYSNSSYDKISTYYGGSDIWLVKLDSQLNIEWQKSYGTRFLDAFSSTAEDKDGNFYIACYSSGMDSVGNRNVPIKGATDTWLIKLDSEGNEIWQKSYGGNSSENFSELVINDSGNLFLAMSSNSNASIDKTSNSINNTYDIWILELDSSGNIINQNTIGTNEYDYISSFKSINNNLVIGISTSASANGDKTTGNYGGSDVWLFNLDDTLGIDWQTSLGGYGDETLNDFFYSDKRNTLFASCASYSGVNGMKTINNKGLTDYWLVELDLNGNVLNQYGAGGSDEDNLIQVIESDGLLYGFGTSRSNASGDKIDNSIGETDIWITTFDVALSVQSVDTDLKPITVYPNPVSSKLNVVGLEDYTSYSIYSISGQLMNQGYTNTTIDVSNLHNGIYFLEIEGYTTQKIVVE